jgi:hypothetical protein
MIVIAAIAYYNRWLMRTFPAPNTSTSLQTTFAAPSTSLPTHLFNNHSVIRHYIVWDTDVIKYTTNKYMTETRTKHLRYITYSIHVRVTGNGTWKDRQKDTTPMT